MKIISQFILLLVACCFVLHAQPARCEFVVYAGDLPPFHYAGEDSKQIEGVSIDILKDIMRESDIVFHPELVRMVPWARAIKETEMHPGYMLLGVAKTEDRLPLFKWIGPLCTVRMGLVAKKSRHIHINKKGDIFRYSIGVINNSAPASLLHGSVGIPMERLTLLTDNLQQFRMLEAERVDLITHVDTVAPYFMRRLGYNPDDYEMVFVMKELPLYIVVNKTTDDAVVHKLQHALDAMKKRPSGGASRYDAILHTHLGGQALEVTGP
ncbi:MAG: substrate-binding periplasmic protein [Halodesulfovibrio sp.]